MRQRVLILAVVLCSSGHFHLRAADPRPAFCAQVKDADLNGLDDPYHRKTSPENSEYCEGLLPKPISLPAPRVISAKRGQNRVPIFKTDSTATLDWCDDGRTPVHIQLRSIKQPFFALDAVATNEFRWSTNSIAQWQPDWDSLAALGTRRVTMSGHNYEVLIPISRGPGAGDSYTFLLQSIDPLYFDTALLEPVAHKGKALQQHIKVEQTKARDTWSVQLRFTGIPDGIFRITFEEARSDVGGAAEPFYLLHNSCRKR